MDLLSLTNLFVNFDESIAPYTRILHDAIVITDSWYIEGTSGSGLNWRIENYVRINDSFIPHGTYKKTLTDTLVITDSFTRHIGRVDQFSDTIIITDRFYFREIEETLTDILTIVDHFTFVKGGGNVLIDIIEINDYFTLAGKFTQIFSDTLVIPDNNVTRRVDNSFVSLPTWIVIKERKDSFNKYVYLYTADSAIVLDSPVFGDIEASVNNVLINRTVGGSRYSYIKTSNRKHLKYEFNLRCNKYLELEAFIDASILDWISLINWKDETWTVKIVNDPITIKAVSRDMYSVVLEFEGYKVTNGNYKCLE
jgi:hypothetical protein